MKMENDYQNDYRLDQYDEDEFDEADYSPLTANQRRLAEEEMRRGEERRRGVGRGGRVRPGARALPGAFSVDEESSPVPSPADNGHVSGDEPPSERESEFVPSPDLAGLGTVGGEVEDRIDLATIINNAGALTQAAARREIGRVFRDFLLTFVPKDLGQASSSSSSSSS